MMLRHRFDARCRGTHLLAFLLLIPIGSACAQEIVQGRGYLRETPLWWQASPLATPARDYRFNNLVHCRLIFRFYPHPSLTSGLELKGRLFAGQAAKQIQQLSDAYYRNHTYFDWSYAFLNDKNAVLVGAVDRAWLTWRVRNLETTVGRQRIAWGTCLTWNPTDVFNPSSPLDFDNEEKPGTDAVRAVWSLGPNSAVDGAASFVNHADSTVAAIRLKLNRWAYDWMLMAGRRGPEAVAGMSWAGSILGGGFRGEGLYLVPRESGSRDRRVSAAVSGDYTFPSSLYLHAEVLYNSLGSTQDAGGVHFLEAYARGDLSPGRISLFAEAAHDLSPLVRVDASAIFNPYDQSWYAGPALFCSVITDLDMTVTGLIFGGGPGTEFGDNGNLVMLRLKWSFGIIG